MALTPFHQAVVPAEEMTRVAKGYIAEAREGRGAFASLLRELGEEKVWDLIVQEATGSSIFKNETHQVSVREKAMGVLHLSIKRIDRSPIHDWRELQEIKSMIAGPEREAVEIYPPESQVVDTANQYHLWVLPEGMTCPFGFRDGRFVDDSSVASSKNRPL